MAAWRSCPAHAPAAIAAAVLLIASGPALRAGQPQEQRPRFRTGIEVVNVTATVTDSAGHFVGNLGPGDFTIYEDGLIQKVTQFTKERVPVSLGILLDTSGSMTGDKIRAAQRALNRFLFDLLDPLDEVFLYRIGDQPKLVQGWTTDRDAVRSQLGQITPDGQTALYDTVAQAVALLQTGKHWKKALLIISDGLDNRSQTSARKVRQLLRESDVLVYAIGIEGNNGVTRVSQQRGRQRPPVRLPPITGPGLRLPPPAQPTPVPPTPTQPGDSEGKGRNPEDGVNEGALRELTDDSGGRTEIIHYSADLDPATEGIADELSRQYSLGYSPTSARDGQWHAIDVVVRNHNHHVRARRGYVAY